MPLDKETLTNYFHEIPEFELIRKSYQVKIINFFLTDRDYFSDPADVYWFLKDGNKFIIVNTIDELLKLSEIMVVKKVLAYRIGFTDLNTLGSWMGMVSNFPRIVDYSAVFLTYISDSLDVSMEEWYIASVESGDTHG